MLVFPTEWGGLERWSGGRERKEYTGSSLERKLKADFLHVCLPGHRSDNVFVCMYTAHPVCSASLDNSNYRWTYRKVSNSSKRTERAKKNVLGVI